MNTKDKELDERIETVRGILRKDLASTSFIPTGLAIQMIAQRDQFSSFRLIFEAILIRMYHDKSRDEIISYLQGPLLIEDVSMCRYLMKSAIKLRHALAKHDGNGKHALSELSEQKSITVEQAKVLLTMCHAVSHEFNIPWSKTYPYEAEFLEDPKPSLLEFFLFWGIAIGVVAGIVWLIRYLFFS